MNSFLDTLKQLGPARLGLLGGILVALMLFFVFVSTNLSSPSMKLLYSDLTQEDASAIAAKLEENEIRYQISPDGARVTVPGDEVGRSRMLLAEAGLPNGGSLGYEIFDKQSSFGTTNFVQNINQVRALEGELARTISSLKSIKSARVHLVLPQRELFSRESRPSSASVFLGVRPGAAVDNSEIVAIQSLVASAVPDLKMANVSIIDSNGTLLARGGEDGTSLMTMKAEEMRRNYEQSLTQKIEDQVSRVVGYGKVRASVTAEVNFDQINTAEELYDPEGQVVRSTQSNAETSADREESGAEDISVGNNLPGVGADLLSDTQPTSESNKTEEITNFEISKTVRNTIREVGEIKRLSVAVLVDGKYIKDADGKQTYEARTQEELDQIRSLINSSVGFDEDRGDTIELVNLPFAEVDTAPEVDDANLLMGFEKSDLIDMAELLTIAVMVILVVLLVLQPMVGRLMAFEGAPKMDPMMGGGNDLLAARPMNPALAAPGAMSSYDSGGDGGREEFNIDLQGMEGKVKGSSIKKVEEIVDNYPAETVSVIRSWMTQESS